MFGQVIRRGLTALAVLTSTGSFAQAKDQLVLAIQGEAEQGYDPTLGWGELGHPLFQSTLLMRDADLATQPDLAKTWKLSPDLKTWTVTIRDDVKFSDGSRLTARDVAFTFQQAARSGGMADLSILEAAQASDDVTVTFRLKAPWVTFQESFYTLGIVPERGYGESYARNPIGSGPYRLLRWDRGQQLIVELNPHYYGPKPQFRRLTFLFTGEDASFAAAQAKQVDIVAVPPSLGNKVPPQMQRVVARTVDNRGLMFPMRRDEGVRNGNAPIGNNVTSDLAIRRAINAALNRKGLVDTVIAGFGTSATGPADGLPWSNPDAVIPDNDPATAQRLLEEAGWKLGADGVRSKDGTRAEFSILYFATDSARQMLAIAVADQLRKIGIAATPMGKSSDEVRRLTHSNVVLYGWGSHNPLEVYHLYRSKLAGSGYYNTGYYANPTVDAHLEAAQASSSLEVSWPAWKAAAFDGTTGYGMKGDAAWAWLVNLDHVYFVDKCLDVGKLQIEPHGHGWPITAGLSNWRWTCP